MHISLKCPTTYVGSKTEMEVLQLETEGNDGGVFTSTPKKPKKKLTRLPRHKKGREFRRFLLKGAKAVQNYSVSEELLREVQDKDTTACEWCNSEKMICLSQ